MRQDGPACGSSSACVAGSYSKATRTGAPGRNPVDTLKERGCRRAERDRGAGPLARKQEWQHHRGEQAGVQKPPEEAIAGARSRPVCRRLGGRSRRGAQHCRQRRRGESSPRAFASAAEAGAAAPWRPQVKSSARAEGQPRAGPANRQPLAECDRAGRPRPFPGAARPGPGPSPAASAWAHRIPAAPRRRPTPQLRRAAGEASSSRAAPHRWQKRAPGRTPDPHCRQVRWTLSPSGWPH